MGPKNIKWWKCNDEMMVKYRERVRRRYDRGVRREEGNSGG